ncbi:MAG: hypothetical protein QOC81_3014 [Thermoanaerobaculia bacterium]|jgi:hypothetical protein|nr:hypothetical protein [Thermoanaerobaculia bacterium]
MNDLHRLTDPLRRTLNGEPVPWPPLARHEAKALAAHGVAPLLYATAGVPELRAEAIRAAALEPLRLADLHEVLGALAAGGVKAILMKGAALGYGLYDAPDHRPRVDTDLLIDLASFGAARRVFRSMGFEEQITSGDEHGLRQRMFRREDRHGAEHTYDVHWAVANSALVANTLRFDEIEPVRLPKAGPDALALPPVEALLLACVHRLAHHHDDDRLIWLVDIARLRARLSKEESARFRALAIERGVAALCARSFAITDEWLGRGEWSIDAPQRREPSRIFLDRELTYGAVTLASLRALPWRARLTRLRQLAFPPVAFMQRSPESQRAILLPWLYFARGFRGISRLLIKARALG